jgi:EF hand domain-containing protein
MKILSAPPHPLRLGCALALLAATSLSQAQSMRSVQPAAQPTRPSGLVSPAPSPGDQTSQSPAGLRSPTPVDAGVAPQSRGTRAPAVADRTPQATNASHGPYTALQIAQSFLGADANRDGELTRAEAQRLSIMPSSFEEMDRNHDGILSRFEYEDGVR